MTPRPTHNDPKILRQTVLGCWHDIQQWLVATGESPTGIEARKEEYVDQLVDAWNWDAYRMATALDRKGWDPNTELVRILEDLVPTSLCELLKATKTWAAEHAPTPLRKLGDSVRVPDKKGNLVEGVISEVNLEMARYTVFSEALGHKSPKTRGSGVTGSFFPFEQLDSP